MIKRVISDTLSFFSVYVIYINLVDIVTNHRVAVLIEFDLAPFFFLLATFNLLLEKERKEYKDLEIEDRR